MSETQYVQGLNALVVTVASNLEASFVAYEQIADPTLAEFVAFVEQEIAVEYAVRQGFEALDPFNSIADVHQVVADGLTRLLAAAEGLVAVAGTVSSLEEAEQTPEFAEYQAVHADSEGICLDMQAKINDLETGRSCQAIHAALESQKRRGPLQDRGPLSWSGTASIRRPLVFQTHSGCSGTSQYVSIGPISGGL